MSILQKNVYLIIYTRKQEKEIGKIRSIKEIEGGWGGWIIGSERIKRESNIIMKEIKGNEKREEINWQSKQEREKTL